MALNIKSPEADQLARDLSAVTGESLTAAVENALRERLERQRSDRALRIRRHLRLLSDEIRGLSVVDARHPDAIIGYDDTGLPA